MAGWLRAMGGVGVAALLVMVSAPALAQEAEEPPAEETPPRLTLRPLDPQPKEYPDPGDPGQDGPFPGLASAAADLDPGQLDPFESAPDRLVVRFHGQPENDRPDAVAIVGLLDPDQRPDLQIRRPGSGAVHHRPRFRPPRPVGVTHLLDPMPTEVHMVVAQLAGRPLLVATGEPQRIWLVTGEGIAEVRAPVEGPGR